MSTGLLAAANGATRPVTGGSQVSWHKTGTQLARLGQRASTPRPTLRPANSIARNSSHSQVIIIAGVSTARAAAADSTRSYRDGRIDLAGPPADIDGGIRTAPYNWRRVMSNGCDS